MTATSPILLTGSHRSGSTWAGQLLASHRRLAYVWEPFNYEHRPARAPLEGPFHFVTAPQQGAFRAYLDPLITLHPPWREQVREDPRPRAVARTLARSLRATTRRLRGCRALVKDPIALLSAEWLARTYAMDVILLVRHPAAFVSSLLRVGWRFQFAALLRQRELVRELLAPFEEEITAHLASERSALDEAILLWCVLHGVIHTFEQRQPRWKLARHEDLSRDPLGGFAALLSHVGLSMTPEVQRAIRRYSAEGNAGEVAADAEHQLRRNSRLNIWNWQRRLQPEDIARIRERTEPIASHWYGPADWAPRA